MEARSLYRMEWFKGLLLGGLVLVLLVAFLPGCSGLPSLEGRSVTRVDRETGDTFLGRTVQPLIAAHPGLSGIRPLQDAHDAFAARVLLAQVAERTLDVQYYIWRNDMTGTLLFHALHQAAERGVRVRLLLDDNNTAGLDPILAALNSHPNIEVRLFNPITTRKFRWIGYLTDFSRLNRRMHNKSFTIDNQATVIGGRNVGDEYFGATEGVLFADLDVLAIGPVVEAVSEDFDRYWASGSSYPVERILPAVSEEVQRQLTEKAKALEQDPAAAAYMKALRQSDFVQEMHQGGLAFEWAETRLVSDDPAKGLGLAAPEKLLTARLAEILEIPQTDVELVSPYLVPTAAGVKAFAEIARQGVAVRILTNALEATDVALVHSGYAKRRKELLEAGIRLYELRREAATPIDEDKHKIFGSSGSSLHAKTFSVDRSHVFVGSFNFDPRSADLNTEMGLVIHSPALAQQIEAQFNDRIPLSAYEVRLDENGQLYWLERRDGQLLRHDTEPGTTFWQRAGVYLMSLLPIEWLL